jgi:hypothetical protein
LATVITNLLSAIPVFGQDIVELKIITATACPPYLNIQEEGQNFSPLATYPYYILFDFLKASHNTSAWFNGWTTSTQTMLGWEEIKSISTFISVLPTVGTVNKHALKKGKKIRLDKKDYLSIPFQFIAFLVGLIEGVGYIQITRTPKGYIQIKLIIEIHLEDLSILEYIQSVLKLGQIIINKDNKSPNCKIIVNRTDLQEVIFPLLIHHNIFFLTESLRYQFDLAMFILKKDLIVYKEIPNVNNINTIFKLPETASDYLKLNFLSN